MGRFSTKQVIDEPAPYLKTGTGGKINQQVDQANSWVAGGFNPSQGAGQAASDAKAGWNSATGKTAKDNKQSKLEASQAEQDAKAQGVLGEMKTSGQNYYDQMENSYRGPGGYQGQMNSAADNYAAYVEKLKKETEGQAKDSKAVYSNDILPKLKANMQQAMTLQQAMDPNNAVAQATRKLYGDQASGINREGLADAGVLQAMGTQATMGQMAGGMPMTGGQLQAIQGANLGQSGAAMARAQQRANDLRQQGVQAGFDRTDQAYNQGQQSIANFENANNRMNDYQSGFRQTGYGMGQDIFGTKMGQANANLGIGTGLSGLKYGLENQLQNKELAGIDAKYGAQQGNIINGINASTAGSNAGMNAAGTIGGAIIGSYAGSPTAGAAAGQAAAKSQNAPMQQAPAQANYGLNSQNPYTQRSPGAAGDGPYGPGAGSAPGGAYDGGYTAMSRGYQDPYRQAG